MVCIDNVRRETAKVGSHSYHTGIKRSGYDTKTFGVPLRAGDCLGMQFQDQCGALSVNQIIVHAGFSGQPNGRRIKRAVVAKSLRIAPIGGQYKQSVILSRKRIRDTTDTVQQLATLGAPCIEKCQR